jgi:hypothetical protein
MKIFSYCILKCYDMQDDLQKKRLQKVQLFFGSSTDW